MWRAPIGDLEDAPQKCGYLRSTSGVFSLQGAMAILGESPWEMPIARSCRDRASKTRPVQQITKRQFSRPIDDQEQQQRAPQHVLAQCHLTAFRQQDLPV